MHTIAIRISHVGYDEHVKLLPLTLALIYSLRISFDFSAHLAGPILVSPFHFGDLCS